MFTNKGNVLKRYIAMLMTIMMLISPFDSINIQTALAKESVSVETITPENAASPCDATVPEATTTPEVTVAPELSTSPEVTIKPEVTDAPVITTAPEIFVEQTPISEQTAGYGEIETGIMVEGYAYVHTSASDVKLYQNPNLTSRVGTIEDSHALLCATEYLYRENQSAAVLVSFNTKDGRVSGYVSEQKLQSEVVPLADVKNKIESEHLTIDAWQDSDRKLPLIEAAFTYENEKTPSPEATHSADELYKAQITLSKGSSIRLRKTAEQNAGSNRKAANGSIVSVTEEADEWCWVVCEDGKCGYIPTKYLTKIAEVEPTIKPTEAPEVEPTTAVQTERPTNEPSSDSLTMTDSVQDTSATQEQYVPDLETVDAIRAAIDGLPAVEYIQMLDTNIDSDELDEIYTSLCDVEILFTNAEEALTDDQRVKFEASIGTEYMAKYAAIYACFLNMTAPAALLDYAQGSLSFSTLNGLASTATTYDLQTDTSGTYALRYVPDPVGTSNTVLVIRWLEYGATIQTLPNTSATGIDEVVQLDSHSIAVRLSGGLTDEFLLDIKLKTIALTQAQAETWMDNGSLPVTSISATEYELSEGNLADVLTNGTAHSTTTYCTVTPAEYDEDIAATHTYKFSVSSVGTLTNQMLKSAGLYWSNNGHLCGQHQNGMLRYRIPTVHSGSNSLVELKGIKIYCPDEKLQLTGVDTTGAAGSASLGRDLTRRDFDEIWSEWIVGARQTETTGPNAGKSYYVITPNSRWFNIGSDTNLDAEFYGVRLIWNLIDADNSGNYEASEELAYSATAYTDLQAADTELLFRCPDDSADETYTHAGPLVQTFVRVDTDAFFHAYNPVRHEDNIPNNNVIINSYHTNEQFTYTSNTWYVDKAGGLNTEHVPAYNGAVTQSFDFPTEISPTKIYFTESAQNSSSTSTSGKNTILESLTYTLADGTVVHAAETDISAINAKYAKYNNTRTGKPTYYSCDLGSYPLSAASEGNPVSNVLIVWSSLNTPYRFAYPFGTPTVNNVSTTGGITKVTQKNDQHTVGIGFDYRVGEYHDLDKTDPIRDYEMAQVQYTLTADGYTNANESNADYLWFRFRVPACPDLYGTYTDVTNNNFPKYGDGTSMHSMGHVGFYVGTYGERKDDVLNPIFDLTMQFHNDYAGNVPDSKYGDNNITGITETQGLAFLTGAFTAMPKLSGWKIAYSTMNGYSGSVTVPVITDAAGQRFQIPLAAGDAFTSIQFSYDGVVNLPHASETDTNTVIWLMKDIQIRALNENPFTGSVINTKTAFSSGFIRLNGMLHTDNCTCSDADHTQSDAHDGQALIVPGMGQESQTPPMQRLYFTRKASLTYSGVTRPATVQNIYQGESVNDTFIPMVMPGADKQSPRAFNQSSTTIYSLYPWSIAEAAYIELTDSEFLPDLSNTYFYGEAATSDHVNAKVITVSGRRFLKLSFTDGYIRTKAWGSGNVGSVPITEYRENHFQNGWTVVPGSYLNYANYTQVAGPIQIGFMTLPGTSVGIHNPIGEVYLDFSELLDKYDAPNTTGYDYNRTDYVFINAVSDDLGLSDSAATEAKLFMFDCSADSATPYSVNVIRAAVLSASIAPGKLEYLYDFSTRVTPFVASEREQLNAVVTMEAPAGSNVYDMTAYVKIPNIANGGVDWLDNSNVLQHSNSQYNMRLRRAPSEYSSSGTVGTITYAYTTDAQPSENSAYTTAEPVTEADWAAVTGVRISCSELHAASALNIKLDLTADTKDHVGDIYAYSGGTYKYRASENATSFDDGYLPLATWKYTDHTISANVFWDTYDENGLRGITGATGSATEKGVPNITAQLFSREGVLIDSAVTDADGNYVLRSCTNEARQYIQLTMPTNQVKLTRQSTESFTDSALDSDFDRETNRLVLPALPTNGFVNVSAGLVKLPVLTADDVTVEIGNTAGLTAVLKDFFGKPLPADSYNITFGESANTAIADVAEGTHVVTGTLPTNSRTITVTGVTVGTTSAKITTTNTLGDAVEVIVNITVTTSYSDISVKKVWVDNNNGFGARPAGIEVQLQRSIPGGAPENVGNAVSLSGTGWSHTFSHQPDYDTGGNRYTYSVVETNVPVNYNVSYSTDSTGALVVTNTIQTIEVSGVKTWDERSTGYIRPESISVTLYRDGAAMTPAASYTKTVTATDADPADANRWLYSFGHVLEYNPSTGQPYVYTVTEAPFGATGPSDPGYNYSTELNGTNVTNMYPAKLFYSVTKSWDHGDLPTALQADSATVMLYRDGALFTGELTCGGSKTLTDVDGWTYTFEVNLADAQGHSFSIAELPVPGYTSQIGAMVVDETDNTRVSCAVTNTYTPTPVTYNPSVKKTIDGTVPTGAVAKEFAFTFTSEIPNQPMPGGSANTTITATISGTGTLSFGIITFTKAGNYVYTIQETDRSLQAGYTGYSFDATEYTLTFVVEDVQGNGTLTVTPTVKNEDDIEAALPLTFTNTYTPAPAFLELPVTKAIQYIQPKTDKEFSFTLTAVTADAPMPADDTLTIIGSKTVRFGEIRYTQAGTYQYTLVENEGADIGYTYDATTYEITVTVTDTNGVLSATWTAKAGNVNADALVFTNNYQPLSTKVSIPVEKVLEGSATPSDKAFTFTMTAVTANAPLPAPAAITINGAGEESFADITFDAEGTYSYIVTETNGGEEGYDYDATVYIVTVTVTDQNGQLQAVWEVADDDTVEKLTFTNTYQPASVELNLPVKKTITGNETPEDKEFSFTIAAVTADAPMPEETEISITGTGETTFGAIAFTQAGEYQYSLTETDGGEQGYTYDTEVRTVKVTVTDNNGTLEAAWKLEDNDAATTVEFTNEYQPATVELTIPVTKELTGSETPEDKVFTFELSAKTSDAPMPDPAQISITGAGSASFAAITFEKAGQYRYELAEQNGGEPGYGYDLTTRNLLITVTDVGGELKYTMEIDGREADGATFVNSYSTEDVKLSLPVEKIITGDETPEDKAFHFTLTAQDGAPMPQDAANGTSSVTIYGSGSSAFGQITYTAAGVYNYTVREEAGTENGYTYDGTEYNVAVTVVDQNSVLSATWTANDGTQIIFTNGYKPAETMLTMPVTKRIDGNTAEAKEFSFVLEGKDGAPMPEGDGNTASVTGVGETEFGTITYTTVGTYHYTVREEQGTEPGYTYAKAVVNVTVTVTDTDGQLNAAFTSNGENADEIAFVNTYEPAPVSVDLGATKILKNKRLQAGMFSFILSDADGKPLQTVTNGDDGSVKFEAITYTQAGTYVYTITEKQGDMARVTYDTTTYTVTVTVTDDNGVLKAEVDRGAADNVFTNTYKPSSADIPKTGDGPDRLYCSTLLGLVALALLLVLRDKRKKVR